MICYLTAAVSIMNIVHHRRTNMQLPPFSVQIQSSPECQLWVLTKSWTSVGFLRRSPSTWVSPQCLYFLSMCKHHSQLVVHRASHVRTLQFQGELEQTRPQLLVSSYTKCWRWVASFSINYVRHIFNKVRLSFKQNHHVLMSYCSSFRCK